MKQSVNRPKRCPRAGAAAWVLLLALLLPGLLACARETPGPAGEQTAQGGSSGQTSVEETRPPLDRHPVEQLVLAEEGKSDYVLVRSDTAAGWVSDAMVRFSRAFSETTGVELPMETDYEGRGSTYQRTEKEIIIGQTNREDSYDVDYSLIGDGFWIGVSCEWLIITASCEGGLNAGIEYFFSEFLQTDLSGTVAFVTDTLTVPGSYSYLGEVLLYDFLGVSPERFRIVYPQGALIEQRYAVRLAETLRTLTGLSLPVADDGTAAQEYEILLGETNRGQGGAGAESLCIRTTGQEIFFDGDGFFAYDAMLQWVASCMDAGRLRISAGLELTLPAATNAAPDTAYALDRAGDYRVMFQNVLWDNTAETPAAERNLLTAALIEAYLPDVVGLQEVSPNKRAQCGEQDIALLLAELGYTEADPGEIGNGYGVNFVPIFYRADAVTLIDCGWYWYRAQNNPISADDKASKSLTWAVFEAASGERFVVVSTHMCTQSDAVRLQQAGELTELLDELSAEYPYPVLVGGDFNANMNSESYAWLTGQGGLKNTADLATQYASPYRGNFTYPQYRGELGFVTSDSTVQDVLDSRRADGVDRILCRQWESLDIRVFALVIHEIALSSSDHLPMILDFSLG